MASDNIGPPATWKTLLEARAFAERANFTLTQPMMRHLPRGNDDPALVLPGFTASDASTAPLRRLLRSLDHRTFSWQLGSNVGPTPQILRGLVSRLEYVYERCGRRPVHLVGWSLGGIYARELARSMPELVAGVITLGSPIQMVGDDRSSVQGMWELMQRFHSRDFRRSERDVHRPALRVPNTSIYSRTDGVVSWQASLVERTPISENVRVFGSHTGLGFNTAAAFAVADRLAQPAGAWRHFRPPWWAWAMFPPADDLDAARLPGAA